MLFYELLNKLMPGHFGTRLRFFRKLGYKLSLDNPSSFNEKVQWRKIHDRNPLFPICADKFKAREYVKDRVGEKYLIPLLYSGDILTAQTLTNIEGDFVVKANHNSGPVHIVEQHKNPDFNHIAHNINQQLKKPYSTKNGEWWYQKIPPVALIEKLLRDKDGHLPEDFKFFIFNQDGKTDVVLQLIFDRHNHKSATFYDENLNILPFSREFTNQNRPIEKPKNFELMVDIAKRLSLGFDFVRVDLYNVDGLIYFGEMTFSPASGTGKFVPQEYDFWMGEKWHLNTKASHGNE